MEYIINVPYEITSCQNCPCKHFDKFSTICHLSKDGERRYGSCPLIALPEHGDLIERDKLIDCAKHSYSIGYHYVTVNDIREAPTILEASK